MAEILTPTPRQAVEVNIEALAAATNNGVKLTQLEKMANRLQMPFVMAKTEEVLSDEREKHWLEMLKVSGANPWDWPAHIAGYKAAETARILPSGVLAISTDLMCAKTRNGSVEMVGKPENGEQLVEDLQQVIKQGEKIDCIGLGLAFRDHNAKLHLQQLGIIVHTPIHPVGEAIIRKAQDNPKNCNTPGGIPFYGSGSRQDLCVYNIMDGSAPSRISLKRPGYRPVHYGFIPAGDRADRKLTINMMGGGGPIIPEVVQMMVEKGSFDKLFEY